MEAHRRARRTFRDCSYIRGCETRSSAFYGGLTFKELLVSDDSIVLCVYFIVLGVVVIVGMGGISCVSKEEKAIDDAVEKISEAIEKLESKLRAQDLEIERLKRARRGRE